MEMTQLYYFTVVCEEMNYTRAAERLFISRQALTKSMKKLEEEFGYPLFVLSRNKLSLAPFGQHLLERGRPIMESFQSMSASLVSDFEKDFGKITVRMSQCLSPFLMPELQQYLADFQQEYPEVPLDLQEFQDDEFLLPEKMEDVVYVVMRMPQERTDAYQQVLKSEPLMLHVNRKNPLASLKSVTVRDLKNELFCCPGDVNVYFPDLAEAYRDCFGREMPTVLLPEGGEALKAVRENKLCSLGINLAKQPGRQSVPVSTRLLDFSDHRFFLNVEVVCRKEFAARPLVKLLLEYLRRRG